MMNSTSLSVLLLLLAQLSSVSSRELNVGKDKDHRTIRSALKSAVRGDVVRIHPGRYFETDLHIKAPITLRGTPGAIIDGKGNTGSILYVDADSVHILGLTIHNVPMSYVDDNAAIKVIKRRNVTVERCEIQNGFFGVYLDQSQNCKVAFNRMTARNGEESNSGNGVHAWTCRNIHVEGNVINGHRDGIYFEFMHQGTAINNQSVGNLRYGLHFMFSDSCSYSDNVFMRNGAGVAVMYTKYIEMKRNTFKDNWGPSSYGLLLKDITNSHIKNNRFISNSVAVHGEGATDILFQDNHFVRNGYAMRLLGNCEMNTVTNNTFDGNTFDVSTNSRESNNFFYKNYWSAYEGYDLNRDGFGDVPFHPVRLYSALVQQLPSSVVLMHSLFVSILDLTERIIPTITPETLIDSHPRMKPLHD